MKHWRRWALGLVLLWIIAVTVWALSPITVNVRTALNADGSEKTVSVECDSPLSGNTTPSSALPTLGPGESMGDAPCHDPVTSDRTLYIIDVLAAAGIVILLVASRGRLDERPAPTNTNEAAALA
jgi:hypothetical protein